ncbi:Protein of unknown function [Gryllus bimaculatus]|nr:Protein of unknown function [Gryllus bimaculatus]
MAVTASDPVNSNICPSGRLQHLTFPLTGPLFPVPHKSSMPPDRSLVKVNYETVMQVMIDREWVSVSAEKMLTSAESGHQNSAQIKKSSCTGGWRSTIWRSLRQPVDAAQGRCRRREKSLPALRAWAWRSEEEEARGFSYETKLSNSHGADIDIVVSAGQTSLNHSWAKSSLTTSCVANSYGFMSLSSLHSRREGSCRHRQIRRARTTLLLIVGRRVVQRSLPGPSWRLRPRAPRRQAEPKERALLSWRAAGCSTHAVGSHIRISIFFWHRFSYETKLSNSHGADIDIVVSAGQTSLNHSWAKSSLTTSCVANSYGFMSLSSLHSRREGSCRHRQIRRARTTLLLIVGRRVVQRSLPGPSWRLRPRAPRRQAEPKERALLSWRAAGCSTHAVGSHSALALIDGFYFINALLNLYVGLESEDGGNNVNLQNVMQNTFEEIDMKINHCNKKRMQLILKEHSISSGLIFGKMSLPTISNFDEIYYAWSVMSERIFCQVVDALLGRNR